MDERQKLFFCRVIPVALRPAYFSYLLLLAKRPKEIITRQELYERQISDHKRKLIAQIRKGVAEKISVETGELETLIFYQAEGGVYAECGEGERADPPFAKGGHILRQILLDKL